MTRGGSSILPCSSATTLVRDPCRTENLKNVGLLISPISELVVFFFLVHAHYGFGLPLPRRSAIGSHLSPSLGVSGRSPRIT